MMEEMMNAKHAETNANLKEMIEEIKSGQAKMKSTIGAVWSELEDVNHKIQDLHKELTDKTQKKKNRQTELQAVEVSLEKEAPGRPSK
jgi:predicted  nucleic acid-binding Zn-ribbon protein